MLTDNHCKKLRKTLLKNNLKRGIAYNTRVKPLVCLFFLEGGGGGGGFIAIKLFFYSSPSHKSTNIGNIAHLKACKAEQGEATCWDLLAPKTNMKH